MTSWQINPPQHSPPFLLRERHRDEVIQFLCRDTPLNLFQLSWIENHGVESARQHYYFQGLRNPHQRLSAVALVIANRLLIFDSAAPGDPSILAKWYRTSQMRFQHIVASQSCLNEFWPTYSQPTPHSDIIQARLIQDQEKYILTPELFHRNIECHPHLLWQPSNIRYAELSDIDALFLASAQMHLEETLEDPLEQDPDTFRRHVQHRIETGQSFVWFDDHRRLVFKAEVSCESSYGAQISGVFTPAILRGQGYATRALFAICRLLFELDAPTITLYVNASNEPAKRVYQKLGFRFYAPYQTVFIRY